MNRACEPGFVSLSKPIQPDQAKARKAIAVPLNAEAVLLIRKQIGKHKKHVFSYQGKPVTQVSTVGTRGKGSPSSRQISSPTGRVRSSGGVRLAKP